MCLSFSGYIEQFEYKINIFYSSRIYVVNKNILDNLFLEFFSLFKINHMILC